MFDFLIDDAVEALTADHLVHGSYQDSTLKDLKVLPSEVNPKLKELGLPLVPSQTAKAQSEAKNPGGVGVEAPKLMQKADLDTVKRTAISYILDYHDKRPIRVKLKDLGVTTTQYNDWLKEERFHTLLKRELDARFKNVDIDAQLGLSRLVLDGDLNAIKYYYEFTGKYRPSTETNVNITVVLAKLMDVLVRHLDSEILDTIATEIEREVLAPLGQAS